MLSFVVDWYLDSGYHRLVIAIHVDLSRCFCIFAVLEQGSVHENVVELLALFCWAVCCFVVVLFWKNVFAGTNCCWTVQCLSHYHLPVCMPHECLPTCWSRMRLIRRSLQLAC